jgi:beta-galactosidase
MEEVGQNYGFILYRTKVAGPRLQSKLEFMAMHDRAQVYVNGICQGTVYRNNPDQRLVLDFDQPVNQLDILVENMGRINFGPYLKDYKGLIEPLKLDYQFQSDWEIYPLPLESLADLNFTVHAPDLNDPAAIPAEQPSATAPGLAERPVFYRGRFDAASKGDTFLDLAGWTKGVAYINGFNLGRYWNIGPQKTLYIPAPLLKEEDNEIVIFELHACSRPVITLIDHPDLG